MFVGMLVVCVCVYNLNQVEYYSIIICNIDFSAANTIYFTDENIQYFLNAYTGTHKI